MGSNYNFDVSLFKMIYEGPDPHLPGGEAAQFTLEQDGRVVVYVEIAHVAGRVWRANTIMGCGTVMRAADTLFD